MKSNQSRELQDINLSFNNSDEQMSNRCTIKEQITVLDKDSAIKLIKRFRDQALVYVTIFRDGQDTTSRDFSFMHCLTIKVADISLEFKLEIDKDKASQLSGEIIFTSDENKNSLYGQDFQDELSKTLSCECSYLIYKDDKGIKNWEAPATWSKGKITITLVN